MKRHYITNNRLAKFALVIESPVEIGSDPISTKVLGICAIEQPPYEREFGSGFNPVYPWYPVDATMVVPNAPLEALPEKYAEQLYICATKSEFVPYSEANINITLIFVPKDSSYDPMRAVDELGLENRGLHILNQGTDLNPAFCIGGNEVEISNEGLETSLEISIKGALERLVSQHVAISKRYAESVVVLQQLGYALVATETGAYELIVTGENPVILPPPEAKGCGEGSGYSVASAGTSGYVVYQSTKTNND